MEQVATKPRRLLAEFSVAVWLSAFVLCGCHPPTPASGPLRHDAFLWQPRWSPSVTEALPSAREHFAQLVVLAARISPAETPPTIVRTSPDYAALAALERRVDLAIQIDSFAGPFEPDDHATRAVTALAKECVAEARAAGLDPAELQIDFDCGIRKLAGYRVWLHALREAVLPLRVCPTVLPSWMDRNTFEPLVAETGGFILQVHSVAMPAQPGDCATPLIDPEKARSWVSQAGQFGIPFRVALSTAAYYVAFGPDDALRGISADGPSAAWPEDSRIFRWEADPAALAGLVAEWTRSRPHAMTGLIWHRLPVGGDVLAWSWPTLRALLAAQPPRRALRLTASRPPSCDLVLKNEGERDESLPEQIVATVSGDPPSAADALAGWELQTARGEGETTLTFQRRPGAALYHLPPGGERPIGWVRVASPAQLRLQARQSPDAPPLQLGAPAAEP